VAREVSKAAHRTKVAGRAPKRMRKSISSLRHRRVPDLRGMTIGTWRVLYLTEEEKGGTACASASSAASRNFIEAFKFRKGYALRCPECRIRQEFVGIQADA